MKGVTVKVGTRGSALALAQTGLVIKTLQAVHPNVNFVVVPIKTAGDRIKTAAELRRAGKGLFVKEIEEAGYQVVFSGQKTYNGVAILSKLPMTDIVKNNPKYPDEQQRILAATIDGMRVVCAYVPNGQAVDSDKYTYKMGWLQSFRDWLAEELARNEQLAVLGDYNIAPEDRVRIW